jgi:carboxyl-terminal processing protease
MKYLIDALDLIQSKAYYAYHVTDWEALRAKALDMAANAQTPADCYSAIRMVLEAVGDNHSFFIGEDEKATSGPAGSPLAFGISVLWPERVVVEVFPDSAADRAGVKRWDIVETANGETLSAPAQGRRIPFDSSKPLHLSLLRDGQPLEIEFEAAPIEKAPLPHGSLLQHGIGYVELFVQGPPQQQQDYADLAQQAIREAAAQGAKGWIVDLRCNRGGNMWPMIAGAGPLMGEGLIGSFIYNSDNQPPITWHYLNGAACYKKSDMEQPEAVNTASNPYPAFDPSVTPVAVLTSEFTGSSGEMTLVAFRGRPNTRVFGEATQGLTTAVAMHDLDDGAILGVAESVPADRTGATYDSKIQPDEEIKIDWPCYGTSDDPVIQAAVTWINAQKS